MGETRETTVGAGEYGYVDGAGRVLCRLECRQAEHSRITAATRDPLLVIQGNAAVGRDEVAATAVELQELLARWCGGCARAELTLLP